eukprot:SAG31_NODE_4153_length_3524_cov_2.923862_2_plen_102_part_00
MLRSDRELLVLLREADTGPLLVRPAARVAMPATTMVPSTLEGAIVRGLLLLAAIAVWDALNVTQVCFQDCISLISPQSNPMFVRYVGSERFVREIWFVLPP